MTFDGVQNFTVADITSNLAKRPSDALDQLSRFRFLKVTNVPTSLSGSEVKRLLPNAVEWVFLDNVVQTDFVARMLSSECARRAIVEIEKTSVGNRRLKVELLDAFPSSQVSASLDHLSELRSTDAANEAALYYTFPSESVIASQRAQGFRELKSSNNVVGVGAQRWVDCRSK